MTPIQQRAIDALVRQGFKVVETCTDVVRLSKGADKRLVRTNGETKRANHIERVRP